MSSNMRKISFTELPGLLSFAADNRFNVMLSGEHGIGKTSIITSVLEERGIKHHYFSGATMDPWVDFAGVPSPGKDEHDEAVIRFIRPEHIKSDTEAFIFDEFNRAHPKVRNAVMELIQKKTINGRRFDKLRFIWAAINPANHENSYDVEEVDPAQMDRFEIQASLPYEPCSNYFESTYGDSGKNAVEWWNSLPSDAKKVISPRRLDKGLEVFQLGGPVEYVFAESPDSVIYSFRDSMDSSAFWDRLRGVRFKEPQQRRTEIAEMFSGFTNRKKLMTITHDDAYKSHRWVYAWLPLEICKSFLTELQNDPNTHNCIIEWIKDENSDHPIAQEALNREKSLQGSVNQVLRNITTLGDLKRLVSDLYIKSENDDLKQREAYVDLLDQVITSDVVAGIIVGLIPSCKRNNTLYDLSRYWGLEVYHTKEDTQYSMRDGLRETLNLMMGVPCRRFYFNNFVNMNPDHKVFGLAVSLILAHIIHSPFAHTLYSGMHNNMRQTTIDQVAEEFYSNFKKMLTKGLPPFVSKPWSQYSTKIRVDGSCVMSRLLARTYLDTGTGLYSDKY